MLSLIPVLVHENQALTREPAAAPARFPSYRGPGPGPGPAYWRGYRSESAGSWKSDDTDWQAAPPRANSSCRTVIRPHPIAGDLGPLGHELLCNLGLGTNRLRCALYIRNSQKCLKSSTTRPLSPQIEK